MTYKLYAIRVFSFKWREAVDFYQDIVGMRLVFSDDRLGWAQFDLGGTFLGIERCDPENEEAAGLVGRFAGTSIEVEDIDAVHESLQANGVEFTGPPERQPWGGKLAHFKDPDGNTLTLLGSA